MSASERVTWETCPSCGRCAAVGWRGGIPVEADCPGGCMLTAAEFARRTRQYVPSAVGRWTTAANTWT